MIDPVAHRAAQVFTADRETMEAVRKIADDDALSVLAVDHENKPVPPPFTQETHQVFNAEVLAVLARTVAAQAEELAEQGRRLADLEAV